MSVWDGNMDVWSWCGHLVRMTSGFYLETQGLVGQMSSDLCRTTVMRRWFPKRPCTALKYAIFFYNFIFGGRVGVGPEDVRLTALNRAQSDIVLSETLFMSYHGCKIMCEWSEVSINAVFFCLKNAQTRLDVRLSLFHN